MQKEVYLEEEDNGLSHAGQKPEEIYSKNVKKAKTNN